MRIAHFLLVLILLFSMLSCSSDNERDSFNNIDRTESADSSENSETEDENDAVDSSVIELEEQTSFDELPEYAISGYISQLKALEKEGSSYAELIDFNGDGRLELIVAVANQGSGKYFVYAATPPSVSAIVENKNVCSLKGSTGKVSIFKDKESASLLYSDGSNYNEDGYSVYSLAAEITSFNNVSAPDRYIEAVTTNLKKIETLPPSRSENTPKNVEYYRADKEVSESEYNATEKDLSKGKETVIMQLGKRDDYSVEIVSGLPTISDCLNELNKRSPNQAYDQRAVEDVEGAVKEIRALYYGIEDNPDRFRSVVSGGTKRYYDSANKLVKVEVLPNNDPNTPYGDYSKIYYYNNGTLYFAFVFKGSAENRFYFKYDKLFRWIDEDKEVHDNDFENEQYRRWQDLIMSNAKNSYQE